MIEITGVDLKQFVKDVYDLSQPQGLGILHFTPEPLSDEDAASILSNWDKDGRFALCMDYVHGRACKMDVFREDGKLMIHDNWYDHTEDQLVTLLKRHNMDIAAQLYKKTNHGVACNCADCRK